MKKTIQKIKDHAIQHQIPIIDDDLGTILKFVIETYQLKKVLEIGTATSYSAHVMASSGTEVWTIERNKSRYLIAKSFVEQFEYKDKIHLIFDDALSHALEQKDFDLIFIDAAKSQYINFFEKYQPFLNPHGVILVDNIFFHHLEPSQVKKSTRLLLKKIEKFKLFLSNHPTFHTQILNYGDGISISYQNESIYDDISSKIATLFTDKNTRVETK